METYTPEQLNTLMASINTESRDMRLYGLIYELKQDEAEALNMQSKEERVSYVLGAVGVDLAAKLLGLP